MSISPNDQSSWISSPEAGCSDEEAVGTSPALFGSWVAVSIAAEGMRTTCPGTIELPGPNAPSVECGTETVTFNADATYTSVETTDDAGDPASSREEGTWSTQGDTLTLVCELEGTTVDDLQPCGSAEPQSATWGVSGDTLTIVATEPIPPFTEVTGTFRK